MNPLIAKLCPKKIGSEIQPSERIDYGARETYSRNPAMVQMHDLQTAHPE
jgi:hypothetical protein